MSIEKLAPIKPGEILLEEFIKPLGISQRRLAKVIGVPSNRISQIISGKRQITPDTAIRLGKCFGIEPQFWINLQTNYDLKVSEAQIGSFIAQIPLITSRFSSDQFDHP